MPTRNEMVRMFEAIVQQEIKNHNDQMLATNMSIEQMRRDIEGHKNRYDASLAQIQSRISYLEIALAKEVAERKADTQAVRS